MFRREWNRRDLLKPTPNPQYDYVRVRMTPKQFDTAFGSRECPFPVSSTTLTLTPGQADILIGWLNDEAAEETAESRQKEIAGLLDKIKVEEKRAGLIPRTVNVVSPRSSKVRTLISEDSMLKLYRRHNRACPVQDTRVWRNCECPVWVQGRLDGKPIQKSMKTRNWERAVALVNAMERVSSTSGQVFLHSVLHFRRIRRSWVDDRGNSLADVLSDAGKDGWELVSVLHTAFEIMCFLRDQPRWCCPSSSVLPFQQSRTSIVLRISQKPPV